MYESGLSKPARFLLVILAVLLGLLFIVSGCSKAKAEQEVLIQNKQGVQSIFF